MARKDRSENEKKAIELKLDLLRRDSWHRNMIETLEASMGKPLPLPVMDFVLNVSKWSEIRVRQAAQWIKKIVNTTEQLILTNKPEYFTLFWLHLYGTFDELSMFFNQNPFGLDMDPEKAQIGRLLEKMRREFNDEELTYIDYMRNCCAHPFQSSESVKVIKKNDAWVYEKITYTDRLTKIERTPEERELIFQKYLRMHGNEDRMALNFAARIQPTLRLIDTTLLRWRAKNGF